MGLLSANTVGLVSFLVTAALFIDVAIPGLALAPFAALLAWCLARRRGLRGVREALAGAACSAFLVAPCILLVIVLVKGRLSGSVVKACYVALYIVWLIGPVVFWGIYESEPGYQLLGSDLSSTSPIGSSIDEVVFWVMVSLWVGSAFATFKAWRLIEQVTIEHLTSFKFMMPYAFVSLSIWTFFLSARYLPGFFTVCSEQQAALAGCPP